ncbi:ZIP family metal transporter [Salinibaculum rarum]|uniref:ZIP family metal transporter n=1 Tax=Salinibaculum rarum TaxID=3058903 RepID=UPI00265F2774|nr:ZIP family metal transporter [Salinibaculum sp. KK48]
MTPLESSEVSPTVRSLSPIGLGGTALLGVFSAVALATGLTKVLVVSWVAFVAMALGAVLGSRYDASYPKRLVWGYGLASGAMVTSSAVFLVPQAMGMDPQYGGFGIAAGLLVGYAAHVVGHRLSHINVGLDLTAAQITAHALSAGFIIGIVYGSMPNLGLLLGLAIVSHKGPAGYAAAHRLRESGEPVSALLLPAAAIGLTAIPSALLELPNAPAINGAIFGFAAGVFLHLAMDFLPSCEAGGEVDQVCSLSEHSHRRLDQLRSHAVASTAIGALAVFLAWWVVA